MNKMKLPHASSDASVKKTMYPKTKEHQIQMDGMTRTFEVYIPKSYTGEEKVPMLLSLHGASGHYMPEASIWHFLAERDNFLVVYPEAVLPQKWNIWNMRDDVDDNRYLDTVLDFMTANYAVDETRLYIHGHSMGDNMATTYVFTRGDRFAAAALLNGPTLASVLMDENGELKYHPQTALPVARMHGTLDLKCGFPSTFGIDNKDFETCVTEEEQRELRCTLDQMQKDLWIKKNGCENPPALYIGDPLNIEFYRGKEADFFYYSINGWEHNPELEGYEYIWDQFLSSYRRVGGNIVSQTPKVCISPDRNALAIALSADSIYFDNQIVELPEAMKGHIVNREETLYFPLDLLAELFPGTKIERKFSGDNAMVWYGDRELQVGKGSRIMIVDTHICSCPLIIREDDCLMVPAKEVMWNLYGYDCGQERDVYYFADHPVKVTYDSAYTIRLLLGTAAKLTANQQMEQELLARIKKREAAR